MKKITKKKHRGLKIFGIVLGVLIVLSLIGYFYLNPYIGGVSDWVKQDVPISQTLEKQKAVDDLTFIKNKVNDLHYSARNGLPPAFAKQYDDEIKHLSAKPTVLEVWQAGSRMLHTLDDGHSNLNSYVQQRTYWKINYTMKNDRVYIEIGNQSYPVKKINGTDITILQENAARQLSYENEIYRDFQFLNDLGTESNLRFLGCGSFTNYTVEYEDKGFIKTATFQPDTPKKSSDNKKEKWVSYQIDKAKNVGIFTLNSCDDNDEYKSTLKNFFTEVKKQNIKNIAVDLRYNGGGSSMVLNEFVRYLNVDKIQNYSSNYRIRFFNLQSLFTTIEGKKESDLLFKGNVYVLTSPATFSSAMNFSVVLQDNNLAKVIGGPCGNKPTQYGEVVTFLLPNTKLYFNTTYAYFERPNKKLADAKNQVPDYPVDSKDAVNKLYEIIKK